MDITLTEAAGRGNLSALNSLLAAGADVEDMSTGYTPLQWAAWHDQTAAIDILLSAGASINRASEDGGSNALTLAAAWANTAAVRLLLARGADPDFASAPSKHGAGGMTALHQAARVGNADVVRLLLDGGAEINRMSGGGWHALSWAIYSYREPGSVFLPTGKITDYDAVIRLLVARGADVFISDEDGNSTLASAETCYAERIATLLQV